MKGILKLGLLAAVTMIVVSACSSGNKGSKNDTSSAVNTDNESNGGGDGLSQGGPGGNDYSEGINEGNAMPDSL